MSVMWCMDHFAQSHYPLPRSLAPCQVFCIRPGKIRFASVPASFETCHLNCNYHLPNNDTSTFNGHSTVDLLSLYSINFASCQSAHKSSKWLMWNNKLPGLSVLIACGIICIIHMHIQQLCVHFGLHPLTAPEHSPNVQNRDCGQVKYKCQLHTQPCPRCSPRAWWGCLPPHRPTQHLHGTVCLSTLGKQQTPSVIRHGITSICHVIDLLLLLYSNRDSEEGYRSLTANC